MTLAVPADPAYAGTVRFFASVVARHAELDEELADDLRLAVSEACADAMEGGARGPIEVLLRLEPDGVAVEVRSDQGETPQGAPEVPPRSGQIDRLQLIRALFPETQSARAAGTRVVRFAARSGGAGRA